MRERSKESAGQFTLYADTEPDETKSSRNYEKCPVVLDTCLKCVHIARQDRSSGCSTSSWAFLRYMPTSYYDIM
jgi:hypothetical protein